MSGYLTLKWVHIVSSVLLVGTGFGTAFFFYSTNRSGNVHAIAVVTRLVVRADWWFTTPAAVVQPVTGVAMAWLAGWPLSTPWLAMSLGLYMLAGVCWLPVVKLQLCMARWAAEAARNGSELPAEYRSSARRWERLGYPAFASMLAVFALMVAKPSSWPWG